MVKYTKEEKKKLLKYFGKRTVKNNVIYESCYTAALRDARKITGRSLISGIPLKNSSKKIGCWGGALVYLVLIEHIEKFFKHKIPQRAINSNSPFITALADFADKNYFSNDILSHPKGWSFRGQ